MGPASRHSLATAVRVAPATPDGTVLRTLAADLLHRGAPVEIVEPGASSAADVVILDASAMTDGDALAGATVVVEHTTRPVLVLLSRSDEQLALRMLRLGVKGCLTPPVEAEGLLDGLGAVVDGSVVLDHDLAVRAAVLAARLLDLDRSPADLLGLSQREVQVLERLEGGATAREIAGELYVSHETVRSHLKRIYRKLGVHGRAAAVRRAHADGILPVEAA